jgi:hypothetical protein
VPGQPTTVVVEKLGLDGVTAIYSWGEYRRAVPGWMRVRGTIEGDKIVLKFGEPPRDSTMYLSMRDPKELLVECVGKDGTMRGEFDKKE